MRTDDACASIDAEVNMNKRGDTIDTAAGPARYVGTLNGIVWCSYDERDYGDMCDMFDELRALIGGLPS